nr:hypothetical protein [uncultured Pseudomonas sp.]
MQKLKFKPSTESSWLEIEMGTEFNFLSRTGGPGWSGAEFTMHFQGQPISISASWGTPCGEYLVRVSFVSLPEFLLSDREKIQKLIIEGITSFCAADYDSAFSSKPFACSVNVENTIWKIN